jgi:hypothetical protein
VYIMVFVRSFELLEVLVKMCSFPFSFTVVIILSCFLSEQRYRRCFFAFVFVFYFPLSISRWS